MPGHSALASTSTWYDHPVSVLIKFWRELFARARPQSLLGAQARWQHAASRHHHSRLQQLTVLGVLGMFVLALLYFDSGSSRHRNSAATVLPKAINTAEEQPTSQNFASSLLGDDSDALCRALSQMQVCSHRASLGQTDKGNEVPLLERMARLAAAGVVCFDVDVSLTSDGQLVVGYPGHIASELRAAGRTVPSGQLDTVPWSDYVAAGLDRRHPLLRDVLAAFAEVLAGRKDGGQAGGDAAAAGTGAAVGGEGAAAGVAEGDKGQAAQQQQQQNQEGRDGAGAVAAEEEAKRSGAGKEGQQEKQQQQQQLPAVKEQEAQLQQQEQQQQQRQARLPSPPPQQAQGQGRRMLLLQELGGNQQQQQGSRREVSSRAQSTALLLLELKDGAMHAAAAEQVHNMTRALGIESRVGLWFPRAGPPEEQVAAAAAAAQAAAAAVGEQLQRLGSGLLRVLGLPDSRRAPNGTWVPVPLALQPGDAAAYDIFGPSVRHPDAALAQVVKAAAGRPVVAWVVDALEDAMRVARVGGDVVVANDPLEMRGWLERAASQRCAGAVAGAAAAAADGGDGKAGETAASAAAG
ncbi:hypothetical protein PLESTM_001326300 [Pleodorina starrii]|nr:hypothetical protein PLESTM_001326300 [Pleodorina starrii]